LVFSFLKVQLINSLHQSSQTPWGNSNFVAGCLVVGALVVMARSASLRCHRKYLLPLGVIAIGAALFTLSRGAIIAACVGTVFFLWFKSAQRPQRPLTSTVTASRRRADRILARMSSRVLSVLIPVMAFIAFDHATDLRAQVDDRVYANVDVRVAMYRLAWEEFLDNPLTGSGWASFRDASLMTTGESQTFAHNVALSMLQIGGLLSVPYLVVLAVLVYKALRRGGPYAAAVAAAVAVSMTQPFFESTVGNLIVLPVVLLAGLGAPPEGGDGLHEIPGPYRGNLRPYAAASLTR
jgi:hypothetical protein